MDDALSKMIELIPLQFGDTIEPMTGKLDADWLLFIDPCLSYDPIEVTLDINSRFLPLIKKTLQKEKGRKGLVALLTTLELHVFERHRLSTRITSVAPITIHNRQFGIVLFEKEERKKGDLINLQL
jgi:hypothetical protein